MQRKCFNQFDRLGHIKLCFKEFRAFSVTAGSQGESFNETLTKTRSSSVDFYRKEYLSWKMNRAQKT